MTTEQEFDLAIKIVQSCTATIQCGCVFDEDDAIQLRRACAKFVTAFNAVVFNEGR